MAGAAHGVAGRRARRRRALLPAAAVLVAAACVARVVPWAFQAPLAAGPPPLAVSRQAAAGRPIALTGAAPPRLANTAHVGAPEEAGEEAPPHVLLAAAALAAATASAPGGEGTAWQRMVAVVKLPVFVCLWYFFNVQYNLQNKMLLKCFSATLGVSWLQLASVIPMATLMWLVGFVRVPSLTRDDVKKLVPVGAAFAVGHLLTVASFGSVAISFTHVVKALEPAVNAIASAVILGQVFHPVVYLSLMPVFAGVALASASELSFTPFGFATAMASNFAFVTRNVFAAKFGAVGDMGNDKTERKTNQLAVLTAIAAAVVFPVALVLPGGIRDAPAAWNAAIASGVPAKRLASLIAASCFNFFMYQLSSFWVLSCVPPITHSVLNTLKRIVIIIVSIIVFRTPVKAQNALGTALAVGGIFLYSLTKAHYKGRELK